MSDRYREFDREFDREPNRERSRELDRERNRELPSQWGVRDLAAVRDVGDFRAIRPRDLAAVHYNGRLEEVEKLIAAGYLKRHLFLDPRVKERNSSEVVGLSFEGRRLLRREDPDRPASTIRFRDLAHDADVYPAVAKERARLEAEGAQVTRVIPGEKLAAERARMANRARGEFKRNPPPTWKRQREIAEALDLNVVAGRVLIPDARVQYVDAHGKERHIDVEVTTPSYGRAERAAKREAGFHLVGGVSFTRGRKVFDDQRR